VALLGYTLSMSKQIKADLVKIRVSDLEKAAFQDAADIAGITVSAWARSGYVALRSAICRTLRALSPLGAQHQWPLISISTSRP